jgi:hypothetical protein
VIPKGTVIAEILYPVTEMNILGPKVFEAKLEPAEPEEEFDVSKLDPSKNISYPFTHSVVWTPPRSTLPPDQPLPPVLQDVVDRCADITDEQRGQIADLVREFSDVFSINGELGACDWLMFRIETGNNPPVRSPVRPIPIHYREDVKKIYLGYLRNKIVSHSVSEWNSGMTVATKKDGSLRCCVDLREVNKITQVPNYPLPRTETILENLQGKKFAGICDLANGFHNMLLHPDDRKKTAVSIPIEGIGHVEYNRVLFGAAGAPARFQALLEKVLRPLNILPMMDDVAFGGETFEEMLQTTRKVFLRFRQANLKAKPQKCTLVAKRIKILGHEWTPAGIHTDPDKTVKIVEWPEPHNVTELKGFIGLCSYYSKFIQDFAGKAAPLHRLTHKSVEFGWTKPAQEAFDLLKELLVSAPVLTLYCPNGGKIIISTDASNVSIGMVLAQEQEGAERTLAYHSRLLIPAEKNYCISQRELLAIVEAVKTWHHYVAGAPFLCRSDHRPLEWLHKLKAPQGRLARWIERLSPYQFEIQYARPALIPHADALSRYPVRPCPADCPRCVRVERMDERANDVSARATTLQTAPEFTAAEWISGQNSDPYIEPILRAKQTDCKPTLEQAAALSSDAHALFLQYDSLVFKDGLLYRTFVHNSGDPEKGMLQLVVPRAMVKSILETYHGAPGSGSHSGVSRTLNMIRQRFYWPNYSADVRDFVMSCEICGQKRGGGPRNRAPLRLYHEGSIFGRWNVDIAGPFPTSTDGYKYALVAVEGLTSFPEVIPMKGATAVDVAKALVQIWSRYGACRTIRTDQGRAFEAKVLEEVLRIFQIRRTRCTPARPQANGKVERFIGTLKVALSKYVQLNQRNWPEIIPLILLTYRAAEHSALKYSPAELMYGRRLVLPADLLTCPPNPPPTTLPERLREYPAKLRDTLRQLHDEAATNLRSAAKVMKERYDRTARVTPFQIGDRVWYRDPRRQLGHNPKLQRDWESGWVIREVYNDVLVGIEKGRTRRNVHIDRITRDSRNDDDPMAAPTLRAVRDYWLPEN